MAAYPWRFFRAGGFEQVTLASGDDLRALGSLDQKLWVALACPTTGVEFDATTLKLVDTDGDARVRAPELIAAVEWMGKVLRDLGELTRRADGLPVASIQDSTDEGKAILSTARRVLAELPEKDLTALTVAQTSAAAGVFSRMKFNGDGVLPAASVDDDAVRATVADILSTHEGADDASGEKGVTRDIVASFWDAAAAFEAWWSDAEKDPARIRPLGDGTAAAQAVIDIVGAKIDDFFTRCALSAFDARSAEHMARPASEWATVASRTLATSDETIASFPLAHIASGATLPLGTGLNPAWRGHMETFVAAVVEPILGKRDTLSESEWHDLRDRFAAWRAWQGARAGTAVEPLGVERVRAILASSHRAAIESLIDEDEARRPEANAIEDLDRAARYYRDLHALLENFVSFRDFYAKRNKAIFQYGTLYLDGRSCELCLRVEDPARHQTLASQSYAFLAYCSCVRRGGTERMNIVVAFTGGDSDFLVVGRNGVFYDRKGQDWDATITAVVDNPISIRQAFWAPYKRFARMISTQIERFATERNNAVDARASASVETGATQVAAPGAAAAAGAPAPTPAFDVGRFAGIFAAIGLAVGVIGSTLAAVISGFLGLRIWQMPLAVAGLLLLISGPSMLLAALKLRQRNLGPLLDAGGWAINARARINIPFGASLTGVAALPEGSKRSMVDPYGDKPSPWKFWVALGLLVCVGAILWDMGILQWAWTEFTTPPPALEGSAAPAEASATAGSAAAP